MKTWEEKARELATLQVASSSGRRIHELVAVSEGIDSNPIGLAVITLQGGKPGPRVWLQAQTHGDEPNPTESILRFLDEIDPSNFAGVIVAAPAMHTTAVRHFMREAPLDGKNGNRIWGVDWSKLGHTKVFSYIWMQRVSALIHAFKPDLVVDMHDGGIPLRILSHALYSKNSVDLGPVESLCWKSGMKVIWESQGGRFGGSVGDHMYDLGYPTIMLESGGTGMFIEEDIGEMTFGLKNVFRALEALPGEVEARNDEQLLMVNGDWVRALRAGYFHADKRLGEWVKKGEVLGHIKDLFGQIIEDIEAPVEGIVFGLRHSAAANVGDYIANIGTISSRS